MIRRWALVGVLLISAGTLGAQQSDDPATSAESLAHVHVNSPSKNLWTSTCPDFASGVEHRNALEAFCEWVLTFRDRLPNILSDEKMKRTHPTRYGWLPSDTITMRAHYVDGKVEYSELAINGKATQKTIYDLDGSWSTGELGTVLEGIVIDCAKTKFKFVKRALLDKRPLLGFECEVSRQNNGSWMLQAGDSGTRYTPGFHTRIWLDESTFQLVQCERATKDVDPKYPIQLVTSIIKYAKVDLADHTSFVLPISSDSVSCMTKVHDTYIDCLKNELTFANWRKFGAEHRIMTDTLCPRSRSRVWLETVLAPVACLLASPDLHPLRLGPTIG